MRGGASSAVGAVTSGAYMAAHTETGAPLAAAGLAPAWTPTADSIAETNLAWLMERAGVADYPALHTWSVRHRDAYWTLALERLGIRFDVPPERVADLSTGVEAPRWLPGARLNIAESCFLADPAAVAIVFQAEGGEMQTMTFGKLRELSGQVAANLVRCGFVPGTAIAIFMPMTAEAVAIYLGIVLAGCAVVGIADSFQPQEICSRLQIAKAAAIFTQDVAMRGGKAIPLYTHVAEAGAPRAIVVPAAGGHPAVALREGDLGWAEFLQPAEPFAAVIREPGEYVNILFSSGTTGEPKAIPWTHLTPIKCAADGHFHQDIRPGDVVVWPTNIGWMMGPWLIFASLMNRAAMGLYYGAPTGREFGVFVERSRATMLGVVPSLVKAWRGAECMRGLDWSGLRAFSSTGECSQAADMRWLMEFAGGRPVIEYCGGTEIGGGYITGTVVQPCVPGTFSTPALGLDVVIMGEDCAPADAGELYLIPPSIGLSLELLNKDHHAIYFAETPVGSQGEILRRHGDQMERLPGGLWRGLGRADDTMNLGGIKVSSAEIEKALASVPGVIETAAIAVTSGGGGPSRLIIYAVCTEGAEAGALAAVMQGAIKRNLNPLFKIHEVICVPSLPRTASNKVMRRELRAAYLAGPVA